LAGQEGLLTKITDLKGFSYPSPKGISNVVGPLPWHFGTEHMCIAYRTDSAAVAAYLPEPLEPSSEPDLVIVDFGKWYSLWDQPEQAIINPERTWYQETVHWIGCRYQGQDARFCVQTWVNKDFSLVRGMIMGFNKRFGETYKSTYQSQNPGMPTLGPGTSMGAYTASHGERLFEGRLDIERAIPYEEIPALMQWPQINLRYFPSMDPGGKPSVCELLRIEATDVRKGVAFAGKGHLKLIPSVLEEHTNLPVREIIGGTYFENGATITGGTVLHSWV
jgi:acetoacetate decarboxylase